MPLDSEHRPGPKKLSLHCARGLLALCTPRTRAAMKPPGPSPAQPSRSAHDWSAGQKNVSWTGPGRTVLAWVLGAGDPTVVPDAPEKPEDREAFSGAQGMWISLGF